MIYTVYQIYYEVETKNTKGGEKERLAVHLFGRGADGQRVHQKLIGMRPYFYSPVKPTGHSLITKVEKSIVNMKNEQLWKVYVKYPFQVPKVRSMFDTTYEADILFDMRVRYDCGIRHTISTPDKKVIKKEDIQPLDDVDPIMPIIACIDVEMDDRYGVPNAKYPTAEVLSWVAYDSKKDRFVAFISKEVDHQKVVDKYGVAGKEVIIKTVPDEYRLFLALNQYLKKHPPDIITGWYVDKFDVAYLNGRAETQGFKDLNFKEYAVIDGRDGFDKLHNGELVSRTLDYIAQEELGEGKMARESTWDMYVNNPTKLIDYNIKDVDLTWRILEKQDTIHHFTGIAHVAGSNPEQYRYNSHAVEAFIFHELNGIVALPSKGSLPYTKIDKGGNVHAPCFGLFSPAFCIDLKAAYPGAIISLNMSPDTLIPEDEVIDPSECFTAPSGRRYRKKPIGLIPSLLLKPSGRGLRHRT